MDTAARRQFLENYRIIRHAEGRGSDQEAYYRELPYRDLTGRNPEQWRIRARTYRCFERHVLAAVEQATRRPLDILDLGAGNGWMTYRLSLRKHRVTAIDIFEDRRDGLGALGRYPISLAGAAAEFDRLPFRDTSFDLAIFNSSFHYSSDYRRTIAETRRCLRPFGRLVILDSPVYRRAEHGERMRAERRELFQKTHGFRSDALRSIEYLDERMLEDLAREFHIEWERRQPWYGWRWALRPLKAKLRGKRPPSRFMILAGRFRGA